jgi:malate dehydrogenase (oxaloacetate-decarboxylating)
MENLKKSALLAHKKHQGKIEIKSKVSIRNKTGMSLFYTPGVAEPCKEIFKNSKKVYDYTSKGNLVAVVTDGSAVLGLGNIGALAGLPVMEGKCALFKEFGGVDAIPICLSTQDPDEIIKCVKQIAPSFGGINLEDISAPNCFYIEEKLIKDLDIPVFHDDQHGTAIVCLAGLINALKVVKKEVSKVKIVISGAGAAGIAICKLLLKYGFKNLSLQDSKGLIYEGRLGLNESKKKIAKVTNRKKIKGGLKEVLVDADVFIGVSRPNIVTKEMIKTMAKDSIVFAMSNPDPEIHPKDAKAGGAKIIATGRSDYPNQINNVLVFPGDFKGVLKSRAKKISDEMKISAAYAISSLVKNPTPSKIIPGVFDKRVADAVAKSMSKYI